MVRRNPRSWVSRGGVEFQARWMNIALGHELVGSSENCRLVRWYPLVTGDVLRNPLRPRFNSLVEPAGVPLAHRPWKTTCGSRTGTAKSLASGTIRLPRGCITERDQYRSQEK